MTAGAGYLVAALVLFPAPLLPNERQVPRVLEVDEAQASRDLAREGLTAEVSAREPHPTASPGVVVWQDPPPGVAVPRGSAVSLVVSSGLPRIGVPDVRGFDLDIAQRLLQAAGFRVEVVDTTSAATPAYGTVGVTEPAPGDSVPLGSRVLVHLAK